ncbi:KAP family P-loop NTPase fold protein [Enterobacter cloacae]|uniref:KAP family P-loop NTPase fold protein n=1 Tax=Enterobacter cloacae TaxID=550 RepID=UPI0007354BDA|nr:P-loop NTPase fold protein [Enterobacter cloacae]KTH67175.1 AAA family ATPase [Enterobacter cloacae subsp. cloacae]MDE7634174.1 KAP family NTPase [Enterobacter cloacae]MDR9912808.1 P-loop NTPase fold protein [Enterobacter cloacae subsp. cloacae]HAS1231218.1 AAA family ATPase [Enterobacter cloacae]HAS1236377.1 AAA family ATPase [Enterobacter cloacae]
MSTYHNDQPILGGQNDPDLLNRLDFANHLANILLLNSNDDCLTMSIEAEWGYGKTSVINLIKCALNEKDSLPIIIEYNPWLAGQPETLIQDFLLQFSSQLNIKDKSEAALEASKKLIAYSSLFSLAKLVPGTEPWASIIEKIFSKFGSTAKKIAELKKLDLLGRKKQVEEAIRKINHPIIVIIDDIDRLTPSETFQVLRLVKAVADFSGTSFLLAFDPNYLVSVLDKNNIVNSSEYINKIIQLRVPLPVISDRGMSEIASAELEKLSDKSLTDRFESDQERLSWIYHNYFKQLIKNPRELKRFFNHLRFVLEQIEGQVCFSDLFALSLVATKSNLVYEHIKNTPEAYIGKRFTNDGLLIDKLQDIVDRFSDERCKKLSDFSDRERILMQNLLGEIFPLLQSGGYSHYGVSEPDTAGRVSAPQRLHIAFHYKTPAGYISDQDIINFIQGEVNREEFLEDVLYQNAEERFFEMMTNYAGYCKDESYKILTCIYDTFLFSEKLKSSLEGNYGFMANDLYRRMNWLTNKIISENNDKYRLIKDIVSRQKNAPLGADVLYKVRDQIQNERNKQSWVDAEELAELERIFQQMATEVLSEKKYLDCHLESHIFFELRRTSVEFTSEFIAYVLSEYGLIRLCEIIGETGSDSTNGPYFKFNDDYFGEMLDVHKIRSEAKGLDVSLYPARIQAVLKSILDGKKYYLRDATLGEDW